LTPIHLTINDTTVEAARGETILQAAQKIGIDIPTLCACEDLPPFGGCRMCVVEVDGMRGFPTSCTTPAEEGMIVRTETPALQSLRLETFNMLLSEHPLSCLVCPEKGKCSECMVTIRKSGVTTGCGSCNKDGRCEIQTLSTRLGVDDIRLPVKYRFHPVEKADPFYDRDYNLCVLCGRCVQVCEKLHFMSTLTFVERGPQALVGTAFDRSHVDAGCSFCGACVDHCPTGTLAEKTRKWEGVAENEVESICPYCAAGCSINLQVKKDTVIGAVAGSDTSVNGGNLCVHGRFGLPETVNHTSRLLKPWKLMDGHRFEFAWDEAVELAAGKLSDPEVKNKALQVSSSLPVEDLFIAQKFATKVLRLSSQSPSCKNDPYSRLLAHSTTFDALRQADGVLLAGVDTRYTLSWLEYELKTLRRNGAHVVSVNRQERPLEYFADAVIQTGDDPAGIIHELTATLKANKGGISRLDQAAETLNGCANRVLLIDGTFLTDPMLAANLADLADQLNAGVICLPLQGDVFGALAAGTAPYYGNPSKPDVLYAIGCQPVEGAGFTIYQNSFKPSASVNLALPSSVFTERDGSFVNAEFRQRVFHKAVKPAGLALPDWQIIAAIVRKMGAAGFEYESVEEIREELNATLPAGSWNENTMAGSWFTSIGSPNNPVYLGAPLSTKVAGLAALLGTEYVKAGD
jgi:NADH dehydrogenase/NADH:ubiquinone oxidoreductase subunit G